MDNANLDSDPAFHETQIPAMPGADQANDMEKAVVRHLQIQADLAKANQTIARLTQENAAATRTTVRLSDQIDALKIDIAQLTGQRNLFMREATELACRIDSIVELATTNADALRRTAGRAKEIARFKSEATLTAPVKSADEIEPAALPTVSDMARRQPVSIPISVLDDLPLRGADTTSDRLPAIKFS